MASLNKVTLIGFLGRDCELRYTAQGGAVATLSIATSEVWTDKNTGQRKEHTEWHRVVLWGKLAENVAEYLTKGKQVYVEGSLKTREWEKDGIKRFSTEVKADRLLLLGRKDAPAVAVAANPDAPGDAVDPMDDVPF